MPLAAGDVMRITVKMSWALSDVQNVYHLQASGVSANSDDTILGEIISDLETAYAQYFSLIDDAFTWDSLSVYNLTQDRFMGEDSFVGLSAGGDTSTYPIPIQCAAMVRFPTGTLGSQGRKFLAGWTVNDLDSDSTLNSTAFNAVSLYAAQMLNGCTGSDWSGDYGNWNDDLVRFVPWVRAIVNQYLCTQRRRRPGVGS